MSATTKAVFLRLPMPCVLALTLVLAGCAVTQRESAPPPSAAPPTVEKAEEPEVYGQFTRDTLFDLMVAEIAGQRNRYDIALDNYLQQAHKTRDAGVVERAMRVAEFLGAHPPALEMAILWTEVDPDNPEAFRAAALHQARAGQHERAMYSMQQVLDMHGETHFDFLALAAAQTDEPTRAAMLESISQLLEKNPQNAQLVFAKALLLQQSGDDDAALAVLDQHPQAAAVAPALMLQARVLAGRGQDQDAIGILQEGLIAHPGDTRMRLLLARLLVSTGDLEAASSQFSTLIKQNPGDSDLLLSLALVHLENNQFAQAARDLEQLIEIEPENNTALYHLGIAYRELERNEAALRVWLQVQSGREYLGSRLQVSQLLAEQGKYEELGQTMLAERASNPDLALQLYLIEIETLADHAPEIARLRVDQALEAFKLDTNLLYARAMLAEDAGDVAAMEQDLRRILQNDPDNAMVLNALGYTLADRNEKLDEALQLIERAAALEPDDPAITDSLGWVHYRLGNLDLAETYLRKAYEVYPDDEVAAHLGEVLWVRGKHREARRIWDEALQNDPQSQLIRSTRQRLEAN
ncbi:tetratricopeptide repeat protein [uncultured Halopseudomonas sp.]|uniref:tetratricopeptide repeat protein n=1 Tax=uncultured Halopseudomonas sp. TaxID=2901193 RepID=UPI0030ECD2C3